MRGLGLALSFAVLAAGTVAHGQNGGGVSNIQFNAGSSVQSSRNSDPTVFGAGAGATVGGPPGASFNSFVTVGATAITFESANTGSSPYVSSNSYSNLSFDVHNTTAQSARFQSTITAAGLGFYLADTSGGCLYTSCPQVAAGGYTFADLPGTIGGADVGFNFTISRAATFGNEATVLYSLNGSLSMNRDGPSFSIFDSLGTLPGREAPGSGARSLLRFGDATGNDYAGDINAATGVTYLWDATHIAFDIGSLQDQTLVYSTSVSSTSSVSCVANTQICLIAYSGFGDPVGRGGDVTSFVDQGLFARFSDGPNGPNGLIGGINFAPSVFNIPTFQNGVVTFEPTGGVPEPATWISMIAGFGLLGAALRRRRVLAYT